MIMTTRTTVRASQGVRGTMTTSALLAVGETQTTITTMVHAEAEGRSIVEA
jgi:hypothetical protein